MAKHLVKCYYCKEIFDRDAIPAIQVSAKRYAHKTCAEKYQQPQTQQYVSKDEHDYHALIEYIEKIFQNDYDKIKTDRQIRMYHREYGYSYSGMLKALYYWYDIQGNSIEEANDGVGIIPWIYGMAYQYFYKMYLAHEINKNKNIDQYKPKTKEIAINTPKIHKKYTKLFFEGEDE